MLLVMSRVLIHPHNVHYFARSSDLFVGDFHAFFDILRANNRILILANIDDLHSNEPRT